MACQRLLHSGGHGRKAVPFGFQETTVSAQKINPVTRPSGYNFLKFLLVAALALLSPLTVALADEPRLHFDGQATFEVLGLSKAQAKAIEERLAAKRATSPLAVYVVGAKGDSSQTPLTGTTSLENGILRFRARFPLEPGQAYRASFQPNEPKPGEKLTAAVSQSFTIPKKQAGPATTIAAVYPTQDVLPENQLKFYLHFSAPMSRGEAYRRVHLLNEKGEAIDLPFLELDQELWDSRQERFTLLFDPGRIKRGLKPREDVGPVLEEGKRYTFVVDADWLDAKGNPLAKGVRKTFRSGPPDDQPIDLAHWKITAPRPDGREPLAVQFPKALDHALAEHLIWVETAKGVRVAGSAALADREHRWLFHGERPWAAGDYRVAVDATIEDLAGNSVGKPFEIDVLRPVEKKVETKLHYLPFAVR
jgi:hypothetical protein